MSVLALRVTDSGGTQDYDWVEVTITDGQGPKLTATLEPFASPEGWSRADTSVKLRADDYPAGFASMTYEATGAQSFPSTTVTQNLATLRVTEHGQTTIRFTAKDKLGNTSPVKVVVVKMDRVAPTVTTPTVQLVAPQTLGSDIISARISWTGSDVDSGLNRYQLEQSINGATYTRIGIASPLATSTTKNVPVGSTVRFRVRAIDAVENIGAWVETPVYTVAPYQETSADIAYVGNWTSKTQSGAFGGTYVESPTGTSSATFTFTGRQVAWVAREFTAYGKAEVWLDRVKVATIDLHATSSLTRRILWTSPLVNPAVSHTVQIKYTGLKNGSATGTTISVDGFITLEQ